jgi:hypothetical protein
MKTKQVAISKSEQKRIAIQTYDTDWRGKKERPPKNPKVPIFPPQTARLVNVLNTIIDTDPDPERRWRAYALLSRVCVIWTPPHPPEWPKVEVDYVQETGLLHFKTELLRDTVNLMQHLFPDGAGLPEQEGCGPL